MTIAAARPSLYLAGPDVFFKEPIELGQAKKALCERYGFEGLYPLDKEIEDLSDKLKARAEIYVGNIDLIKRADAVVANATPFKGVDADAGTAFEVGYAAALGKPVHLYSAVDDTLFERNARYAADRLMDATLLRPDDYSVDDFEGGVNLMLLEACIESGGVFVVGESGRAEDLDLFERLLREISAKNA